MAENSEQVHPMTPRQADRAPAAAKHDVESAAPTTVQSEELRRQKRKKLIIYIIAFVIFQTAVIAIFSVTVMKFRNPKFRVRSGTAESIQLGTQTNSLSFNFPLNARLGIKNTNFGPYKYEATTVDFFYRGTLVGSASVSKSKANFRSTKKFDVVANLASPASLASNSQLATDLSSGIVPLTSQGRLTGKVTIMFMMKKRRSTNMNCTMDLNTTDRVIQNLICR